MLRWTDEQLAAYRNVQAEAAEARKEATKPTARAKYRNKKTEIGGVKFDSKAEASRFVALKRMEEAGLITDLRRQVSFELAPAVKIPGKGRMSPPLRYFADFVYVQDGKQVIEDVKGYLTEVYKLKRHLMAVAGYRIVEVRKSATRPVSTDKIVASSLKRGQTPRAA